MAQGIMTGIGFLGAGVIFKEGLTVRGLTTAASIWITATLGVLYGVGFYYPAVVATIATLGVLGGFRWFENRMPSQIFVHLDIRYPRDRVPDVASFRAMLAENGFSAAAIRHSLLADQTCEYRTMIRTNDRGGIDRLAAALLLRDDIADFTLDPAGD
jgi:putative Mg2+ transporter-C (MgtC) family protein